MICAHTHTSGLALKRVDAFTRHIVKVSVGLSAG